MYYAVVAVILATLVFAAIPVVTTGFLSFGGLIGALLATLVLYALLSAPAAWLVFYRKSRSAPLLAACALLPLGAALSPLLLASSIENSAAAVRATDRATLIPVSGIIEIVGMVEGGRYPFDVAECGTLCQGILALKGVRRLRLTFAGDETFSSDFVVRDAAYCKEPVPLDAAVTPPARLAEWLAGGRCIMTDKPEGKAVVVATIADQPAANPAIRLRRISFSYSGEPVAEETEVQYVAPSLPLHLEEGTCTTRGCIAQPVLATEQRVLNPVDPAAVILAMLQPQP